MAAKRAVLVGCNYERTRFSLHGCINDVETMRNLIVNELGFDTADVMVLTDASNSSVFPTGANIKDALRDMVKSAKAGDVLFFYFSGHGTAVPQLPVSSPYVSFPKNPSFREDEAIVPCDFNIITDTDFKEMLKPLAEGVSFTILSDSCHSGALIDKEREQIGLNTLVMQPKPFPNMTRVKYIDFNVICEKRKASILFDPKPTTTSGLLRFCKDFSLKFYSPSYTVADIPEHKGLLMSGCEANQTSFDVLPNGKPYGDLPMLCGK